MVANRSGGGGIGGAGGGDGGGDRPPRRRSPRDHRPDFDPTEQYENDDGDDDYDPALPLRCLEPFMTCMLEYSTHTAGGAPHGRSLAEEIPW